MASITYDGRSFLIDGRREWLVSATVQYSRSVREEWPARLRAARDAGFDCIYAPVVWAVHEPRKGAFDFKGDRDLRHFVGLIGQLGMRCILAPGPFVGGTEDMGGLPAWVGASAPPVDGRAGVRSGLPAFLDAAARWYGAVAAEVKDLQTTSSREGPVVLVQVEHEWFCGHDAAGEGYLGELGRYLRENGITVPLVNSNNLHLPVEGQVDGWSGSTDILRTFRQLRTVRPEAPPMLMWFAPGESPAWGFAQDAKNQPSPAAIQSRLAEALAAGAQFNVSRFFEGTHFGFSGGRSVESDGRWFASGASGIASTLDEAGRPGPSYALVRRIAHFASHFGRVMANLESQRQSIMLAPPEGEAGGVSVAHVEGTRGSVAFLFAGNGGKAGAAELLRADGTSLEVRFGDQRCAWCLFDAHLVGRATLDYCSLCAFALVGRTLVVYGPAGVRGELSIGGASMEVTVPTGKTPVIEEHGGVTVVVCSEALIDATFVTAGAVHVGCAGIDAAGEPIAHADYRTRFTVDAEGKVEKKTAGNVAPATPKVDKAPALSRWFSASADDFVAGTSERYAAIDGPATMSALGASFGYGWMRVRIAGKAAARKPKVGFFELADRGHVYIDGEFTAIAGEGPGASLEPVPVSIGKDGATVCVLIDNLGRHCGGSHLGEAKGLYGHLWEVTSLKVAKPTLVNGEPIDPMSYVAPLMGMRHGDRTEAARVTWEAMHRKKTPLFVTLSKNMGPSLLLVNDTPVRFLESGGVERLRLDPALLKQGKNLLQVAMVGDPSVDGPQAERALTQLAEALEVYEGVECVTEKADWAFAKWDAPADGVYEAAQKGLMTKGAGLPRWWRCGFKTEPSNEPLFFDAAGLSKGQIFLNGKNLCRYFVATRDRKTVPPQTMHHVPASWLKKSGENQIVLFDEHGFPPSRCRLVYGG